MLLQADSSDGGGGGVPPSAPRTGWTGTVWFDTEEEREGQWIGVWVLTGVAALTLDALLLVVYVEI